MVLVMLRFATVDVGIIVGMVVDDVLDRKCTVNRYTHSPSMQLHESPPQSSLIAVQDALVLQGPLVALVLALAVVVGMVVDDVLDRKCTVDRYTHSPSMQLHESPPQSSLIAVQDARVLQGPLVALILALAVVVVARVLMVIVSFAQGLTILLHLPKDEANWCKFTRGATECVQSECGLCRWPIDRGSSAIWPLTRPAMELLLISNPKPGVFYHQGFKWGENCG